MNSFIKEKRFLIDRLKYFTNQIQGERNPFNIVVDLVLLSGIVTEQSRKMRALNDASLNPERNKKVLK